MNMDDILLQIYKGSHPEASDEEAQNEISGWKQAGSGAVNQALSFIPGMNAVKDVATNAPAMVNEAAKSPTVQGIASGLTGGPISDTVPNPGNPISAVAQGTLVGLNTPNAPSMPVATQEDTKLSEPITPPVAPPVTPPIASAPEVATKESTPPMDLGSTAQDDAARQANLTEAGKRRKAMGLLSGVAGIGDAIGSAASAFGVTAPHDKQEKLLEMAKGNFEESKKLFDEKLKNDPNSDVSKAYRQMVLQIAPDLAKNSSFTNMSAAAIGDKLPLIDTMMKAQAQKDAKEMGLKAIASQKEMSHNIQNEARQGKYEQDYSSRLAKIFSNRSGGLGLQDAKTNAAMHSRELIEGNRDKSGEVHINQIVSPELAMSLASLVSGGNAPALETIKNMTPEALQGFVKSKIGFIFGKPVDVLPKAWTDSLIHQLDRQGLTSEALRNQELKALASLRPSQLDKTTAETLEKNFSENLPSYSKRYGLKPLDISSPIHAQTPSSQKTKTINEKNYINQNGQWYEVQ